jgi:hypothetical protein
MIQPDNRKALALLGIAVLLAVLFWLFRGCDSEPVKKAEPLKEKIRTGLLKRDELKKESERKDSVRIVYITRWRKAKEEIKNNPQLPCDSVIPVVINLCDSIIKQDSSTIVSLKEVIKQDSSLFVDYQEQHRNDSTEIANLKKEVKKQKRQKNGIIALFATYESVKEGTRAINAIKN